MRYSIDVLGKAVLALGLALAAGCSGGGDEQSSAESDAQSGESAAQAERADEEKIASPTAQEPSPETVEIEMASAEGDAVVGDASKGKRVFIKCMACHTVVEGQHKIGPSLYKIVGAEAGKAEGFNYSPAMTASGVVWTEEALDAYLANPGEYVPGNKMIFPGLPSAQDRADVIAYLNSVE